MAVVRKQEWICLDCKQILIKLLFFVRIRLYARPALTVTPFSRQRTRSWWCRRGTWTAGRSTSSTPRCSSSSTRRRTSTRRTSESRAPCTSLWRDLRAPSSSSGKYAGFCLQLVRLKRTPGVTNKYFSCEDISLIDINVKLYGPKQVNVNWPHPAGLISLYLEWLIK